MIKYVDCVIEYNMQSIKLKGELLFFLSVLFCMNFTVLLAATCLCTENLCTQAYWGQWASWSSCSKSCGGGINSRNRMCKNIYYFWNTHVYNTGITQSETRSCAEICLKGGVYENSECICPPPSTGVCCEKLPVCTPTCQNGGTCIEHDTCRCTSSFYGQFCEIGSEIDERLQPHFYPAVSAIHHPFSWYDTPSISGYNKICYIKIQMENAYFDTVLTAVSKRADNHSHVFGNFTAAPIDEESKLNQSSRFACLKVRCPGTMSDGLLLDVAVDITVESAQRKCYVRKDLSLLDIKTMADYNDGNDAVALQLERGKNYGEIYGVYVGTGFRDKAEYLAKQSCFSGNIFKRNQRHPNVNVLARFQCI